MLCACCVVVVVCLYNGKILHESCFVNRALSLDVRLRFYWNNINKVLSDSIICKHRELLL